MDQLFPETIPRAKSLSTLGPVVGPHSNEATYVADEDGTRWVAKSEEQMGCNGMLAEAISWLLAKRLGAPVPDAKIWLGGANPVWMSRWVPDLASHWDEALVPKISNIAALGPAIVVDMLVGNADRHARNILLQGSLVPEHLLLWAIDFDDALIGHPGDFTFDPEHIPSVGNLARGLPVDMFEKAARHAADEAKALAGPVIVKLVQEACTIAREENARGVADVLLVRAAKADEFLEKYLEQIRKRR
jgi:hypothetical protein